MTIEEIHKQFSKDTRLIARYDNDDYMDWLEEKLSSPNSEYEAALRVFEEFSKSDDNDFRVTSFYMWINKRLNSQK